MKQMTVVDVKRSLDFRRARFRSGVVVGLLRQAEDLQELACACPRRALGAPPHRTEPRDGEALSRMARRAEQHVVKGGHRSEERLVMDASMYLRTLLRHDDGAISR